MNHFILATAGHVDHGKSALVKALTGTDPDRLPEEKARGITIELGFAHLILDGPNEQRFHIGIIDVPGHEDFVRNMIAGVGSVDLALLVVAADDGWMPQTEEHLQILMYLGVRRAVIALNKSDLGKIDKMTRQIRDQLRETSFADSPIVPTSVHTGAGIENLKRSLAAEFAMLPAPRDIGKPRLFVDRAFSLHGIGTVVTGTLTGGKLLRGQSVKVQPKDLPGRIRSIQSHGRDLEFVEPAMRTAINLADIEVGAGPAGIQRGDVVTMVDLTTASATLDVLVERSSRVDRKAAAGRPIKNVSSVYVHHGTARLPARIALLETETLSCGERALAELRLESPILAFLGDRFVLRDPSEQFTIGGGIVLDPVADRRSFRSAVHHALLRARAGAPRDIDVCLRSELARCRVAQSKMLLRKSNFSADEIAAALIRLQERGAIVLRDEIAADADEWRTLRQRASASIDSAHGGHPEQRGLALVELRSDLRHQSDDVFNALLSDLCANDFVRDRSTIARRSHCAKLPSHLQPVAKKIRAALSAKPFDPPGRKQIANDQHLQHALRFLIEQGEVVEINSDVILLREASVGMQDAIVAFISNTGPATVGELRQGVGTSRRILVPFLEHLDRERVTRRIGDRRILVDEIVATANTALD
jgi:selenocysteine-specific elongation factor